MKVTPSRLIQLQYLVTVNPQVLVSGAAVDDGGGHTEVLNFLLLHLQQFDNVSPQFRLKLGVLSIAAYTLR